MERDIYVRLEKKLNKLFILLTIIFLAPNGMALLEALFQNTHILDELVDIYFCGMYIFAFSIYQSTWLQLMRELYNQHRLAFNSHIKALAGLFMATELTLVFMIGINFTLLFSKSCMLDNLNFHEPQASDSICHFR